jgi:twitching motility protein PilT
MNDDDNLNFDNIFDTAVKHEDDDRVPTMETEDKGELLQHLQAIRNANTRPAKPAPKVYGTDIPEPHEPVPQPALDEPPTFTPVNLGQLQASTIELDSQEAEKDDIYLKVKDAIDSDTPGIEPEFIIGIAAVMRTGASDLHLVCDAPPRIRLDGSLQTVKGTTKWNDSKMSNVLTALASRAQHNEYDQTHELDMAYSIGPKNNPLARFRVNFYHDNNGIAVAMRIIPTIIKSVTELGLPEDFIKLADLPRGLVLVCGPTGSGKSTTLAAIIDKANATRYDHIITVEDPIEFIYKHKNCIVNQREVGSDTDSFAAALKRALRQDPDIIEIGEMRDLETISAALTAAETGHLVFGTLHTQDAPQTIDRIINVFPAVEQEQIAMMLSMSLKAVIVQTLVPKIGGGRVCATEVMYNTGAVANLIRKHQTAQLPTTIQSNKAHGMHTMDMSLADAVKAGKITTKSAMEHSQNVETLKTLISE